MTKEMLKSKWRRIMGEQQYNAKSSSNTGMLGTGHEVEHEKIVSFMTDDFKIRRSISSSKELPLTKYTSLGAVLQNESMRDAFQDAPILVYNSKKDALNRKHILGPLPPEKPEPIPSITIPAQTEVGPERFKEAELPRASLVNMKPSEKDLLWNQPMPPHDGVIWPMAWAPRPPYTTPGYNRIGVRQPVGTVQVDLVPSKPSKGRTDKKEFNLPTWVSPLYRSYGIGGPFGPYGPFYEPPIIDDLEYNGPAFHVDLAMPKKRGLVDRLLNPNNKEPHIDNKDTSMNTFLSVLDENLVAMRRVLRSKKENKEIMLNVVQNLSYILDDAKKFSHKLNISPSNVSNSIMSNETAISKQSST